MAVPIYSPKKSQGDGLSKLLTIGGGLVGGVSSGSFAGAMGGAQAGGMAAGFLNPQKPEADNQVAAGPSDALQRRMANIKQSNLGILNDSIDSLKYVDDPQKRAELAKPLLTAQHMAMKEQA